MVEEIESHILKRYELLNKQGKGAYGVVFKAMDKKTHEIVALKKNFDAFQNATDSQRTYREIMLLQELNGHENIIRLLNVIKAENDKDIYLVFEYMETDLHTVIRANILEPVHKQFIMYQLLKALKFIHSAGIIHRDLKPSNILINSDSYIKVCDFGLARCISSFTGKDVVMTDYVATRWYRAPEILLGSTKYGTQADMWSVGCVIAEMVLGYPIFQGDNSVDQLVEIIKVLGTPKRKEISEMNPEYTKYRFPLVKCYTLKEIFQGYSNIGDDFINLLQNIFVYNPEKRIKPLDALCHPFFDSLRQKNSNTSQVACNNCFSCCFIW